MGCGCGKKNKVKKGIVASVQKAKETASQIIQGWSIYAKGNKDPEVQAMADYRAEICTKCPELKASQFWKFVTSKIVRNGNIELNQIKRQVDQGEEYDLAGYKCAKCGCAFPAALYTKQKECPLGKWGKMEDNESI